MLVKNFEFSSHRRIIDTDRIDACMGTLMLSDPAHQYFILYNAIEAANDGINLIPYTNRLSFEITKNERRVDFSLFLIVEPTAYLNTAEHQWGEEKLISPYHMQLQEYYPKDSALGWSGTRIFTPVFAVYWQGAIYLLHVIDAENTRVCRICAIPHKADNRTNETDNIMQWLSDIGLGINQHLLATAPSLDF